MALLKYLVKQDSSPYHLDVNSPLSSVVPKETISRVNEQVSSVVKKGKKRGKYMKINSEDKLAVAKVCY